MEMTVVMVPPRGLVSLVVGLLELVPKVSRLNADFANGLFWLTLRLGRGQYRVNDGDPRPLSKEVLWPAMASPGGIGVEVWTEER